VCRPSGHLQQLTDDDYNNAEGQLAQLSVDDKVVVISCMLTHGDLLAFDGTSWLNDNVLHVYMGLLAHKSDHRLFMLLSFLGIRWENNDWNGWLFDKGLP